MTLPKYVPPQFRVIRHYGDLNSGTSPLGFEVHRKTEIFIPEYKRFIPCASYDNWFIYEVPPKYKGVPAFLCGCGSIAVIAGMSAYEKDASPSGLMLVCYLHSMTGKHADGST